MSDLGERVMMRCSTMVLASAFGLLLGGTHSPCAQPTSEGHPHKWQAVEKSMTDFVADGFDLKAVVYDTSQTPRTAEPDVRYFLQKGAQLVRCDFSKRGQASIYWCYELTKATKP